MLTSVSKLKDAKADLRAKLFSRLDFSDFSEIDFVRKGLDFFQDLKKEKKVSDPLSVSAYWPMDCHEMPTSGLLKSLHERGCCCLLPVPDASATQPLRFVEWTPSVQLVRGPLGTWIPEGSLRIFKVPNVILLPVVAYDAEGYRLGRGGGYYDATLRFFRSNPKDFLLAVGLAHSSQKVSNVPRQIHDEKMDAVLTQCGWAWF